MAKGLNPAIPFAVIVIVVLLGFLLATCNSKAKVGSSERFVAPNNFPQQRVNPVDSSVASQAPTNPSNASAGLGNYGASDPLGNEMYNPVTSSAKAAAPSCFPRDRLTAEDLLPKDAANSRWAQLNPAGQGDVADQNFLTAGYHVGINTVGSSMKNPNLQLRSEPPAPRVAVSPWNISTIEYSDSQRKSLEIGGDY